MVFVSPSWRKVDCPACGAVKGSRCVTKSGKIAYDAHRARQEAARPGRHRKEY